ncbi:hypothetical protein AKJ29_09885 [Aliiroseovarius crassostreae]|uniref:Integrase catalytic domain-containing protein n=1 Tax=Aliiroseovarius crassostreae TaxID=154981 RepID=A0A0P7KGR6_9RHOB|nr:helix-turn-helix domain-containing protein [Aliiroseovarius crassostreae]KPN62522.1 hypothetical protein AKJ29_09885 [Aliiroseovarius crassostreae]
MTTLSDDRRAEALRRFNILRPHLNDAVPLTKVARASEVSLRTLQRWVARYHRDGLVGLARAPRTDAGRRKIPSELVNLIEGLALHKLRLSRSPMTAQPPTATNSKWSIVIGLKSRMRFGKQTTGSWIFSFRMPMARRYDPGGPLCSMIILVPRPGMPFWWARLQPSKMALTLWQAIWRKDTPSWPICGLPDVLYTDHSSDFTSKHLEQVAADLRIELVFSTVGRPQGCGKIERFFGTINTELLPELPGALPNGKPASPPHRDQVHTSGKP